MSGKQIVERSAGAWNDRDRAAFVDLYAPDCELVTPVQVGKGREAIGEFWDTSMGIYPDNRVRVTLLVEEGEVVVEEGVAAGTNTGPIPLPDGSQAPASGRDISFPFAAVHTIRDGLIVGTRFYWDAADVYRQLGLA